MVDYISGHKQFDVASAIFQKFLRLEQLKQNQRTFGSVDRDAIKSSGTKNTNMKDTELLIWVHLMQQYHIRKY